MQLSFFDHAMKYQGAKKSMKFLNEMKEIIPFEAIEKIWSGASLQDAEQLFDEMINDLNYADPDMDVYSDYSINERIYLYTKT